MVRANRFEQAYRRGITLIKLVKETLQGWNNEPFFSSPEKKDLYQFAFYKARDDLARQTVSCFLIFFNCFQFMWYFISEWKIFKLAK